MKFTFDKVDLKGVKHGKCFCGKNCKKTKTFSQTINPFNKNKKGQIKTVIEIEAELEVEMNLWKEIPVTHSCVNYSRYGLSEEDRKTLDEGKEIKVELTCGHFKWVNRRTWE